MTQRCAISCCRASRLKGHCRRSLNNSSKTCKRSAVQIPHTALVLLQESRQSNQRPQSRLGRSSVKNGKSDQPMASQCGSEYLWPSRRIQNRASNRGNLDTPPAAKCVFGLHNSRLRHKQTQASLEIGIQVEC